MCVFSRPLCGLEGTSRHHPALKRWAILVQSASRTSKHCFGARPVVLWRGQCEYSHPGQSVKQGIFCDSPPQPQPHNSVPPGLPVTQFGSPAGSCSGKRSRSAGSSAGPEATQAPAEAAGWFARFRTRQSRCLFPADLRGSDAGTAKTDRTLRRPRLRCAAILCLGPFTGRGVVPLHFASGRGFRRRYRLRD